MTESTACGLVDWCVLQAGHLEPCSARFQAYGFPIKAKPGQLRLDLPKGSEVTRYERKPVGDGDESYEVEWLEPGDTEEPA